MASVYLPEDIVMKILKRLPVKTILRSKSVCKSWNSLISSPSFSNSYASSDESTTYLRQHKSQYILQREEDNSIRKHLFTVPKPHLSYYATLLDVIHGVLLFTYTSSFDSPTLIVFWNPSVRRHVRLPLDKHVWGHYKLLGGGYDAINNDFKAVWVPYFDKDVEEASRYYQVFSTRAGVWKQRTWTLAVYHDNLIELQKGGCFFNGAIYWRERDDWGNVLVYFDCESEEFGRMELPDQLRDEYGLPKVFVSSGGLLSLLVWDTVWTMKEYGVWSQDLSRRDVIRRRPGYNYYVNKGFLFKESLLLLDIGKPDSQPHDQPHDHGHAHRILAR